MDEMKGPFDLCLCVEFSEKEVLGGYERVRLDYFSPGSSIASHGHSIY